jgi:putative restriction endonuclease
MVKFFSDDRRRESRAVQIWQILIGKAHNRQTITYGELADLLGYQGAGVMAQLLAPIMCYCIQNDLPPLTILVVNSVTGSPGEGLILRGDENSEREKVFTYDWYNIYPPSDDDYYEVVRKGI